MLDYFNYANNALNLDQRRNNGHYIQDRIVFREVWLYMDNYVVDVDNRYQGVDFVVRTSTNF